MDLGSAMSDRLPQAKKDNFADDGETGREQKTTRQSDRTTERSRGGCACCGGGGCCCNMRAEAYGRDSDPLRQKRHDAARARMEATQGDCHIAGDQAVPRHRGRTRHDEVADPDHHIRRHHHHHRHHQGLSAPTAPTHRDNYDNDGERRPTTHNDGYRVIDGGARGGNLSYDEYGQPRQRPQTVDYDRQGRPLDQNGRVIPGAPMQDSVIGYDQAGRTVDQYGRVINDGGQAQQVDQYGRPCDRDGRPIGRTGRDEDDSDRYNRRDGDPYDRARYDNDRDRSDRERYENDRDRSDRERYDNDRDRSDRDRQQVIGYDTYGRPVDQYGRVVSGAPGDPALNDDRIRSSEEWYRRHPGRSPMDERVPGVWDPTYGVYGRDYDYGRYGQYGRYGRDGVHVGIGPNGQFDIGVQTNGVGIDVGTGGRLGRGNVYDYYRGRYDGRRPIPPGEDYEDYYGRYEDPNGRGGRYYRPGGQVYNYDQYNDYPRYDSRYARRHSNGVDIGAVLPLGRNGGFVSADVNNIFRMFGR